MIGIDFRYVPKYFKLVAVFKVHSGFMTSISSSILLCKYLGIFDIDIYLHVRYFHNLGT